MVYVVTMYVQAQSYLKDSYYCLCCCNFELTVFIGVCVSAQCVCVCVCVCVKNCRAESRWNLLFADVLTLTSCYWAVACSLTRLALLSLSIYTSLVDATRLLLLT
jgi:hypothetical protein